MANFAITGLTLHITGPDMQTQQGQRNLIGSVVY